MRHIRENTDAAMRGGVRDSSMNQANSDHRYAAAKRKKTGPGRICAALGEFGPGGIIGRRFPGWPISEFQEWAFMLASASGISGGQITGGWSGASVGDVRG